jgi:2-polyprenyl-3-methyl-5-hydroxy-6-metoxy-1,4-benzoquinol methylase
MTETHPTPDDTPEASLAASPAPACALCGRSGVLLHADLRDRHFDAPGTWQELCCPGCQLVWLNPRPTPEDLPRLYADYYTHAEPREVSLLRAAIMQGIPAARLGYADAVSDPRVRGLGRLLGLFGPLAEMGCRGVMGLPASKRGRLLDFGCGDGAFLQHMSRLGWEVAGVEQDPVAAAVAAEAIAADVIHANVEQAREALPEGFDVITLGHVIEHLLDPVETLKQCAAALRPGGQLVMITPNVDSLGHQQFGSSWLHLDPPRHIYLFDARTLAEVTQRAGLRVESVETPSSTAQFVYRASALIERQGRLPGIQADGLGVLGLARAGLYWMREYARTRFGSACGEELLLTASRPDGEALLEG